MNTVLEITRGITMKRKNAFTFIFAGLLALSLASCGGGNSAGGDGGSTSGNTSQELNGGVASGTTANADQLAANIRSGSFSQQSVPGVYLFQKASGSINSSCTWNKYYGNEDDKLGVRALGNDLSILRDYDIQRCGDPVRLTFSEEAHYGANLGELANFLADKVIEAKNAHTTYNIRLKKVVNGALVSYVAPDAECYGNAQCEYIKTVDSKIWDLYYEGGWKRIDLNQALIKQPILR